MLKDAALEREIESALAVDPSPEFIVRIRARVAAEPTPTMRWYSWRLVSVTTAIGAVAIAAWFVWPSARVEPLPTIGVSQTLPETSVVDATPKGEPARVLQAVHPDAPRMTRQQARIVPTLPEVLIPENEKRGFELLLEELHDGKDAAIVARAASRHDAPGPPWLDVQPVVIEPLHDVIVSQGEGQ
ncbi:MAG TPA: hypothetical protein VKB50_31025 [Vicinamibacterales bacterium]|nr:hypothetical protein [Vicinamibacterales bacterium]